MNELMLLFQDIGEIANRPEYKKKELEGALSGARTFLDFLGVKYDNTDFSSTNMSGYEFVWNLRSALRDVYEHSTVDMEIPDVVGDLMGSIMGDEHRVGEERLFSFLANQYKPLVSYN